MYVLGRLPLDILPFCHGLDIFFNVRRAAAPIHGISSELIQQHLYRIILGP